VITSEQGLLYTAREGSCTDIIMYTRKARLHHSPPPLFISYAPLILSHSYLSSFAHLREQHFLLMKDLVQKRRLKRVRRLHLSPAPASGPPHVYNLFVVAPTELSRLNSDVQHDRILVAGDTAVHHWDLRDLVGLVSFALRQAIPVPICVLQSWHKTGRRNCRRRSRYRLRS
jgi:hypothetical protein